MPSGALFLLRQNNGRKVYSFSGMLGMKGWIYIATMTNTVGVVKIGYSDRDPDERVKEWSKGSGVPGEGKVEYAAWVNGPEQHEKRVHKLLEDKREKGSEWFKCSLKEAYDAVTEDMRGIIFEDFREDLQRQQEDARKAVEPMEAARLAVKADTDRLAVKKAQAAQAKQDELTRHSHSSDPIYRDPLKEKIKWAKRDKDD
jgi:hypothetical protein